MQISKQVIDPDIERSIHSALSQVLAEIKKPSEVETFLKGLLTNAEVVALSKRLAIAYSLKQGKSYDDIRKHLKVSSATIASVQDKLQQGQGLDIAIKKLEQDAWADNLAKKIMSVFDKKTS